MSFTCKLVFFLKSKSLFNVFCCFCMFVNTHLACLRSSSPEVFLGKGVLKICSKFTGEHSHWSLFSLSCSATPLISQMCISQKVKVAIFRSSHPEVFFKKRCSESMQQIYRRTLMQKCDFNKVALQLYWNRTSGWVSSRSFTEYFQHTSS